MGRMVKPKMYRIQRKKIIMRRVREQETGSVHFWFEDASFNYIASVVGKPGDIRTRISTPKGSKEFGMAFAARDEYELRETMKKVKMWRSVIARQLRRMGHDAMDDGKNIVIIRFGREGR